MQILFWSKLHVFLSQWHFEKHLQRHLWIKFKTYSSNLFARNSKSCQCKLKFNNGERDPIAYSSDYSWNSSRAEWDTWPVSSAWLWLIPVSAWIPALSAGWRCLSPVHPPGRGPVLPPRGAPPAHPLLPPHWPVTAVTTNRHQGKNNNDRKFAFPCPSTLEERTFKVL